MAAMRIFCYIAVIHQCLRPDDMHSQTYAGVLLQLLVISKSMSRIYSESLVIHNFHDSFE